MSGIFATILITSLMLCGCGNSGIFISDKNVKMATKITSEINSGWYKLLDFDDKKEYENATKYRVVFSGDFNIVEP